MPIQLGDSLSIGRVQLGEISIGSIYLGDKLVFSGQNWPWCLADNLGALLETSDGYKIQIKFKEEAD